MTILYGSNTGLMVHAENGEPHGDAMRAFQRGLNILVQCNVIDKDLTAPPGAPADGDAYIVGPAPTGAWAAHAKDIAAWNASAAAWDFYTPLPGWQSYVADEDTHYQFTGSSVWQVSTTLASGDVLSYKGVIDCSANPNYPAADAGDVYFVSVAGLIGGGAGPSVEVGDMLICKTDATAAGTHAGVGANWQIIQTNMATAVQGPVGPVTADAPAVFDSTTGRLIKEVTYAAFAASLGTNVKSLECIPIACSDETTALTTGTAKVTFRMPYAFTLTGVRASVTTAPTGGTLLTVDINEAGASILSTKLTFDASEKTTTTAATPAVISDSSLADDAEMTIDIDAVGSTIAGAGLKVYLIGHRT